VCYLLHPLTLLPQVLVLIIGEEHTIVAWYVLRSESWVEMRVGLSFLRDRLERLPPRSRADAHSALDELEEWWSDRCCDGAADVKKHPIVAIFHGSRIWRAPRKDTFHAINGVNKTGDEGVPEQKSQLGTGLFNALREIPDSELQPVVDYLKRKSSIDDLAARTKARTEYRHHGIIRNRTFTSKRQLKRWQAVRKKWEVRYAESRRTGERCVIRKQRGQRQGTLEAMEAVEPCIAKGCLCDPEGWRMEDMYIDTRVQPVTRLQERLHVGDSGKNEARHRVLNELVEHVSRVGEDVMEADLDFLLFFCNRQYDLLFGRIDAHSLDCFPWSDGDLNREAAHLDGPPPFPLAAAPRNALPPIEPIEEGHPRWEPLGFTYLHYLQRNSGDRAVAVALAASEAAAAEEAELEDDEIDESQLDSPISQAMLAQRASAASAAPATAPEASALHSPTRAPVVARAVPPPQSAAAAGKVSRALQQTPSTSVNGGAGKRGSRWSGARKARVATVENSTPVEPTSFEERQVMAAAITQAMQSHGSATDAMYLSAAEIYNEKAILILTDPLKAPPSPERLRPRTSASLLKQVSKRCMRRQLRVGQELEIGSSSTSDAAAGQADDTLLADEIAAAHTPLVSTSLTSPPQEKASPHMPPPMHLPPSQPSLDALQNAAGGAPLSPALLTGMPMEMALRDFELEPLASTLNHALPNSRKRSRTEADRERSAAARKTLRSATITIARSDVMTIKIGILTERLIPSGKLQKPILTRLPRDADGKRLRRAEFDVRSDILLAWPDGQEAITLES
jgi:hypothetical protein